MLPPPEDEDVERRALHEGKKIASPDEPLAVVTKAHHLAGAF